MCKNKLLDVLIVGSGPSGIGAACHFQRTDKSINYAIVEARKNLGGTWDLFRYPGIRSDSDMYTLGFSFRPWKEKKAIADGASILKYYQDTAREYGVDEKIIYDFRVKKANYNQKIGMWSVTGQRGDEEEIIHCKFLHICTGYYDYKKGHTPDYKKRDLFKGIFIHPQKWDESINYIDKKIVVIGSGATAVTLVPELSKKAKLVTMLQRSPSYVASVPQIDYIAEISKKIFSEQLAYSLIRWKNILFVHSFYQFSMKFPNLSRKLLSFLTHKELGKKKKNMFKHFNPKYKPWEQRLCAVPDGDLFKAIKKEKVNIVTENIECFTENGILLKNGKTLEADIIVSATGLNIKFIDNIKISIDEEAINIRDSISYKGIMFSGVPNFSMVFGYTNSSWTLKADLTNEWVAKTISHMKKNNLKTAIPQKNPDVTPIPFVSLNSSYIQRSLHLFPKQGDKNPWAVNQNYFLDIYQLKKSNQRYKGLEFHA